MVGLKAKDTGGRIICGGVAALIGIQSFYQYRCGYFDPSEYRIVATLCKLWTDFRCVLFYGGIGFVLNVGLQPNNISKERGTVMNIGLIAHDAKKKLMQNFCIAYRGILSKHELYATETTGILVESVTNLSIHKFLAGHLGGKQQLGSQIEHNI